MKEKKNGALAVLVGANIAAHRKRKRWTQAEFGEKLGIGSDSLCRIERGVMAPRFQRLQEIAQFLDCSVADLFKTPEEIINASRTAGTSSAKNLPLDIPAEISRLSEQITLLSKLL